MKTKQQKYEEAVQRALPNAKRIVAAVNAEGKSYTFNELKIKLGIRKNDTSFDEQLQAIMYKILGDAIAKGL
jgi:hypothetical protein